MTFLDIVWSTVLEEFSDLSDIEMATRVTLRLMLAMILGGLLGYEREKQGISAGVRTHMLVCLGAALFLMIPEQSGAGEDAMSRVIQGVVAGVGFLCAGTILKGGDVTEVRGLTTAAGLWLTAAMGSAVGMGFEATAIFSTLLALFVLHTVPFLIENRTHARRVRGNDAGANDLDV